jgi:hypothetical protein
VKELHQAGRDETSLGARAELAGDDPEPRPPARERRDYVDHFGVGLHAIFVVREMVLAIGRDHGLDEVRILGDRRELLPKGRSQSLAPHRVRRRDREVALGRVAIGAEDEIDGVDERAVEIER